MIGCNEKINFGQPSLVGRRLTVYNIVTIIYYEDNIKDALEDYDITMADAKEATVYCMNLKCQEDVNLKNFCDGCLLRTLNDGWSFNIMEYKEIEGLNSQKITITKDSKDVFLGSMQELEDSEFGKITWMLAKDIFKKL